MSLEFADDDLRNAIASEPPSQGYCGLWQSSTPRAPPAVDGLVLELDAAYSASSIDSSDQVDRSQELSYVDIDTFLASF